MRCEVSMKDPAATSVAQTARLTRLGLVTASALGLLVAADGVEDVSFTHIPFDTMHALAVSPSDELDPPGRRAHPLWQTGLRHPLGPRHPAVCAIAERSLDRSSRPPRPLPLLPIGERGLLPGEVHLGQVFQRRGAYVGHVGG